MQFLTQFLPHIGAGAATKTQTPPLSYGAIEQALLRNLSTFCGIKLAPRNCVLCYSTITKVKLMISLYMSFC